MTLRLARPLAVAALLAAPLLPVAAHAGTFSALDAFGDSLSDAGNDYLALTIAHQPPEPVSPPYSNGRFSNGAVWAQDLAVAEGLASVTPSLKGGTDYAYGGAETGATAVHALSPLDLPGQLAVAAAKGHISSTALVTLSIGGNDLFDIIASSLPTGGLTVAQSAAIKQAVTNEIAFVSGVVALGARHFVVMNVPDLGHVPAVAGLGALASGTGTAAAKAYNSQLKTALTALALVSGAKIAVLDAFTLVDQVAADPAPMGFANVTLPCWTGDYVNAASGAVCAATKAGQDKYLFWDTIHPTEHAHSVLAAQALTIAK